LLERGASKVYAGAREVTSLESLRAHHGDRIVPVLLDVTSQRDRDAAADLCGDVDLLVSNAGITSIGPVLDVEESQLREAFEVNVFGPLALVRAFAPALRAHRGGVILVHSLASMIISRSAPTYSASKSASLMLGYGLREQRRADHVVVTNVLPGFVETDMTTHMPSTKASPEVVAQRCLEAWEQGLALVWPDRYAETVHHALLTDMPSILDDPFAVATRLTHDFRNDPLAGT